MSQIANETEIVPAAKPMEIAEYQPMAQALAALRERFGGVQFDCKEPEQDRMARAARLELVKLRTTLEAKRKEIKAPALERTRQIDSVARQIETEILLLEDPIDYQIKAEEERRRLEKVAREKAEKDRVADIHMRINTLRNFVVKAPPRATSEQLAAALGRLEAAPVDDSFQEFRELAEAVKREAIQALGEMRDAAVEREAEGERLRLERLELERVRAEQEAFLAEERARHRREFEEEQARNRAELDEQIRRDKEANDRRVAERLAEDERIAEARRIERQQIDEARARIEAEQKERDEQFERERRNKEELERAEREKNDIIIAAALDYYDDVESLIEAEGLHGFRSKMFQARWEELKELHEKTKAAVQ